MSATAELTHPATMALDRRAELIEELAPHGVSFGYQSTGGEWIETSTATLERVAPAFATKSSMLTAPPIICALMSMSSRFMPGVTVTFVRSTRRPLTNVSPVASVFTYVVDVS